VHVYRRLAGANPAAFDPDLARSLWTVGSVHVQLEMCTAEAVEATRESVAIYERLVTDLPASFAADLRAAAGALADLLDLSGATDDAAQVRQRYQVGTTA
jgi:hypothetical protein